MLVNFNISSSIKEPFVSVNAAEKSPDLVDLGRAISRIVATQPIVGFKDNTQTPLPLYQIVRFKTSGKSVICQTTTGTYRVKYRIYELVDLLAKEAFIQTSSSEIINLNYLKSLSATASGLYQVNLTTGESTYISRRFMKTLRKELLK